MEKFAKRCITAVRRNRKIQYILLLLPGIAYLTIIFMVPFFLTTLQSFGMVNRLKQIVFTPTPRWYLYAFGMRGLFTIFLRSVTYGVVTTLLCVILGYPVAYYIAVKCKYKDFVLLLFMVPLWVSFLLRTYALMGIFSREAGLLNHLLLGLGIIKEPLGIFWRTPLAVLIGMVYNYLLFMVLPLYACLEKLDLSLLEAASTLGAGRVTTFFRVILPLSLPGIVAGSLLVFIPTTGEFIIPDLLGGTESYMIGNIIYSNFLITRVWEIGSAISLLFVAFILAIILIYLKYAGIREVVF
ncbi:ABC transporter permease [Candidatus Bathyarchaeota archaeon]|nr:ABC transporter permease [Candidatus Bathyarchaeota archaeon]